MTFKYGTGRGTGGRYASNSNPVPIAVGDSVIADAFGRMRVSTPTTIFDSTAQYENSAALWESKIVAGALATHLPNESSVSLTVTSGTTDSVIRQTRSYFPYQPGKSQLILATFVLGVDAGISLVKRSKVTGNVVDTPIAKADWNVDPMDGTGPSGVTLDFTKAQILWIDIEWLGVGRVRTGFVVDGMLITAHQFLHANVLSTVYMTTATLPVRYELTNDAENTTRLVGYGDVSNGLFLRAQNAVGAATLKSICCSVTSEGGFEDVISRLASASNGVTEVSVADGQRYQAISIRPKLTYNSIANRITIAPLSCPVFATGGPAVIELVAGGALSGTPTWVSAGDSSAVEYTVHAATTVTGGRVLSTFFVAAGGLGVNAYGTVQRMSVSARVPLTLDIAGAHPTTPFTDVLSVVVQPATSTTTAVLAAIEWREIH